MMRSLRAFLILGRISNLPTVWSNCLAGWLLGGAGPTRFLPALFAGASCLYVAGMFLNDAFDFEFDRKHRPERPIPSGAVAVKTVWAVGFGLLLAGAALLFLAGFTTGCLGVLLALAIVLYDAVHKRTPFSPVLMALCRFLLYLTAASTGTVGVQFWVICDAVALAAYIIGLSYLAKRENFPGALRNWPLVFLALPVALAVARETSNHTETALLIALALGLWTLRCLRSTFWTTQPNIGQTVSGLLAGIVLVDWTAVAGMSREVGFAFIAFFLAALLFQRFVPAT